MRVRERTGNDSVVLQESGWLRKIFLDLRETRACFADKIVVISYAMRLLRGHHVALFTVCFDM